MAVSQKSCGGEKGCLSIADIGIAFDDTTVLNRASFEVRRGTIVSLLGPNGCGKTTLLKILGKLLKPDSGHVYVDGKSVEAMRQADLSRLMGSVSQSHQSSFPFSVLDVVLTGRLPYVSALSVPGRADTDKSREALEALGIAHLSDRPYTKISGGERQLAMIARALAQEPRLLLLDEPTTYLDLRNQVRVLNTVARLCKERNITVLMTLHDPNHAFAYSDEVVLLKKAGQDMGSNVVAAGEPSQVLTPCNIMEAYGVDVEIVEHRGRKIVVPAR